MNYICKQNNRHIFSLIIACINGDKRAYIFNFTCTFYFRTDIKCKRVSTSILITLDNKTNDIYLPKDFFKVNLGEILRER